MPAFAGAAIFAGGATLAGDTTLVGGACCSADLRLALGNTKRRPANGVLAWPFFWFRAARAAVATGRVSFRFNIEIIDRFRCIQVHK
jgi:hypothetical protein